MISPSNISCSVYSGDSGTNPSIPTVIAIPILQAIPANTQIAFNILNLLNPSQSSYPVGMTFKLANACSNGDTNNYCSYYKSTYYMQFNAAAGIPGVGTTGSHTFNPTYVSATNSAHTIAASYPLNAGDYLKIIYYSQVQIPSVCTMTSGNGFCYSYPIQNTIIIKSNITYASSFSFTLSGMTNLYQYQGPNLYT